MGMLAAAIAAGRENAKRRVRPDRIRANLAVLDVERQTQVGGAGPPRGHGAEGAPHGLRQLVGAVDDLGALGERTVERFLVQFSERVTAARGGGDVGGDAQHRDRALVRLHDSRQQVGRAASRRTLADAYAPADARIAVRHVGCGALVPGQDVLHAMVEARERVVERQAGVAAQAENVLHAVQLQHAHHRLCARHLAHFAIPSSSAASASGAVICGLWLASISWWPQPSCLARS